MPVHVLDHPSALDALGRMRDAATGHREMRELARRLGMLLAVEALRGIKTEPGTVQGWAGPVPVQRFDGSRFTVVPILRAGLGLLEGVLALVPDARVGVVGVRRDEATLAPHTYACKLGERLDGQTVLVIDPMLATAGTAIATIDRIRERGATDIHGLFLVAAPEGVAALQQAHPDVAIHVAALDQRLNERGYILPGLGDAGDRIFGVVG